MSPPLRGSSEYCSSYVQSVWVQLGEENSVDLLTSPSPSVFLSSNASSATATKIRSFLFLLNPTLRFHINDPIKCKPLNRDVRPPSCAPHSPCTPQPHLPQTPCCSHPLPLTSCPTSDLTHPLTLSSGSTFLKPDSFECPRLQGDPCPFPALSDILCVFLMLCFPVSYHDLFVCPSTPLGCEDTEGRT